MAIAAAHPVIFMKPILDPSSASAASSGVLPAIRSASAKTGIDFDYLVEAARRESNFDAGARAKTSSAAGLFQFIEQTWLRMLKQYGARHGLGAEAAKIDRGEDGRYRVADPAFAGPILDLRYDPHAAAAMAGEYSSENARALEKSLGRPASAGDLYTAHFLGARGAISLIRLAEGSPDAAAAEAFPQEASANRNIFYDRDGRARSARELRDLLASQQAGDGLGRVADRGGLKVEGLTVTREPGRPASGFRISPQTLASLLSLDPLSILRKTRG